MYISIHVYIHIHTRGVLHYGQTLLARDDGTDESIQGWCVDVGCKRTVYVHGLARDWPVNEIQVEVVQPEEPERLAHRRLDLVRGVLGVPQLGGDEHLGARQPCLREDFLQRLANLALVVVDGGAVYVGVPAAQRRLHGVADFPGLALPRSQADV